MMAETQLGSGYLRLQAGRCRRLSENCMDLGTAGDLRQMSEEYFATASKMEADQSGVADMPDGEDKKRIAAEKSYYSHRFLAH